MRSATFSLDAPGVEELTDPLHAPPRTDALIAFRNDVRLKPGGDQADELLLNVRSHH